MKLELASLVSFQLDEILSVDDELGSLEDGSELDVSLNELEQSNISLDDETVGVESLELLDHADELPSDEPSGVVVSEELPVGIEDEAAWPLDWSESEEEDMKELPKVSLDEAIPDGSGSLDGDVSLEPGSPVDDDVWSLADPSLPELPDPLTPEPDDVVFPLEEADASLDALLELGEAPELPLSQGLLPEGSSGEEVPPDEVDGLLGESPELVGGEPLLDASPPDDDGAPLDGSPVEALPD